MTAYDVLQFIFNSVSIPSVFKCIAEVTPLVFVIAHISHHTCCRDFCAQNTRSYEVNTGLASTLGATDSSCM